MKAGSSASSSSVSRIQGAQGAKEMTKSSAAGSRASGIQSKGPMTRDPSTQSGLPAESKRSLRRRATAPRLGARFAHLHASNLDCAAEELGRVTDILIPKLHDEISRLEKDCQESL